jgi:hypothetical protein
MAGGGGGKSPTQTSTNEPWAGQKDALQFGFGEARKVYDSGAPQYFPGQTLAGIDPAQTAALDATEQRAMAGSPLTGAAQGQAFDTLGGAYLGAGNPYFSAMADRVGDQVTKQMNSTFGGAGRFGSGAHANALASGLSDAIGGLAYQNYGQERQNMLGAMSAAPGLAEADYADLAHLGQVGDARRALEQGQIDDDLARYNYEQNLPWQRLANYQQMIQGNYGGTNTTTQSTQRGSLGAGLIGGGLAGAGTGAMIGSVVPGIGTAIGAGVGGLLGAVGGGMSR